LKQVIAGKQKPQEDWNTSHYETQKRIWNTLRFWNTIFF